MNRHQSLISELCTLLNRYSDEEVGKAIKSVLIARLESDDLRESKGSSIRLTKGKAPSVKTEQPQTKSAFRYTPRFMSSLPNRDLRTMNMSELRRIANLVGVPSTAKDSKARLLARLKNFSTIDKETSEIVTRPQSGEYEGWVNMIVKSRNGKRR